MQTLRMQLGLSPVSFSPVFLTSQADADRWTITADILADIADVANQHGVPTLFVLIPAALQVDSELLQQNIRGFHLDPTTIDVDQPNRIMRDALTERGLTVYDVLPDFRQANEAGRRLYGRVDPHFSPEGNRLFASLVAPLAAEILRGAADETPGRR
jgi:hypothetical protein